MQDGEPAEKGRSFTVALIPQAGGPAEKLEVKVKGQEDTQEAEGEMQVEVHLRNGPSGRLRAAKDAGSIPSRPCEGGPGRARG